MIRKLRLTSKFLTSSTRKQTVTITHNAQTWKIIFLENHKQNIVKKLVSDCFLKKSKIEHIPGSKIWNFIHFFNYYCMSKVKDYQKELKQGAGHLFLPHVKVFKTTKEGLELVFWPHFLYDFWRKIFFLLYCINWPNFLNVLLLEILHNTCIVIIRILADEITSF